MTEGRLAFIIFVICFVAAGIIAFHYGISACCAGGGNRAFGNKVVAKLRDNSRFCFLAARALHYL